MLDRTKACDRVTDKASSHRPMDSHTDPITQFFPDQDSVDLYDVLSVPNDSKTESIRKAYRRLALVYHPDKHATASAGARAEASTKFQQIGFAYAVLGDEKRRQRYDRTGKTDEGFELGAGDDGWEAYFEEMFERVTRGKLDEMKKEYQGRVSDAYSTQICLINHSVGSAEEIKDLKTAYTTTGGSIGQIMTHIPHSTHDDEARFIIVISDLIARGDLPTLDTWQASVKDEKAKLVRRKQSEREAKEAEKLARELGVWDEFYGSGKQAERKGKAKGEEDGGHEDYSALQALILKKNGKSMDSFFDGLAAKYTESEPKGKGKGKKRGRVEEQEEMSPRKKSRKPEPQMPDIDDEEFEKLQARLFSDKGKVSTSTGPQAKTGKGRRKAK
ncbi:hypothetical protein H0H81_003888 [Sphagnurus paluster]|uniref:J domain-containing protein n=1 Tax=Sphagnurus paluster TaxID=117069 RepID=A0A9P7GTA1_9AGAR|nr:hypothetical protein H0H81_003888 [Sphagnurus paluster]